MKAKVKPLPPAPDSVDRLTAAWAAVPLVPKPEESCCARLIARVDVPSQDQAKEWLTFMRGLDIVAEGNRGFYRLREHPHDIDLTQRFRMGVYGVEPVLEILTAADEPLGTEAAFDAFTDRVPNWERHHNPDWRSVWQERVTRLLDWAVRFDLIDSTGDNYLMPDRLHGR